MITVRLLFYCKKVFILMNIWMIAKYSMKYHYLKEKIFSHMKVCKEFEKKKKKFRRIS